MQKTNLYDNTQAYPEETKKGESFNSMKKLKSDDDIVNDLIKYFEDIFNIENFKRNKYFLNRTNPYLEISLRDVEIENGVRGITNNKNLISKALSQVSSISLMSNGVVKIKNLQPRNKIIIRDITIEDELELKKLLARYEDNNKIISNVYEPKLKFSIISLVDEASANNLLNYLFSQEIKGHPIDCGLSEENILISMKNELRQKPRYQPYQTFLTEPFQMAFNPQMYIYPNMMQYPQLQVPFHQRPYPRYQKQNFPKMNQNHIQSSYQGVHIPTNDNESHSHNQQQMPVADTQNEENFDQTSGIQKKEEIQSTNNTGVSFTGMQKNFKGRPRNNYNRGPRNYPGPGYGMQFQQLMPPTGYYQNQGQYQTPYQMHNQGYYSGFNKTNKGKYNNPGNNKPQQKEEILADDKNFPPLKE